MPPNPGRRVIMVPVKPMARAVMRRARMGSPKKTTAITVAKRGAEKPSAATLARGTKLMPMKNRVMDTTLMPPRRKCRPGRRVLNGSMPRRIKAGEKASKPKRLRKKAISRGCNSVDTWRMIAFMAAKAKAQASMYNMPRWRLKATPNFQVVVVRGFMTRSAKLHFTAL
jgi:hypothetical protein